MAAVIGTYNYTHKTGDQHNRVVRPEDPETIQTSVLALKLDFPDSLSQG